MKVFIGSVEIVVYFVLIFDIVNPIRCGLVYCGKHFLIKGGESRERLFNCLCFQGKNTDFCFSCDQ